MREWRPTSNSKVKLGVWGDGEMGRWGDGKIGRFLFRVIILT
ncbi:hypothetical protein [Moorena sp. SIOASIH]|nr:hypothetical protein [Moorena sp. SIOASIH]